MLLRTYKSRAESSIVRFVFVLFAAAFKGNRVEIYVKAHRKTLFFLLAGMENDPAVSQFYLFHCAFVISLFERGNKERDKPHTLDKKVRAEITSQRALIVDWKDVKKNVGHQCSPPAHWAIDPAASHEMPRHGKVRQN